MAQKGNKNQREHTKMYTMQREIRAFSTMNKSMERIKRQTGRIYQNLRAK